DKSLWLGAAIFGPKYLDYLIVKSGIGGNGVRTPDRVGTVPRAESATGLMENRRKWGTIPGVHSGIEHDVGTAGGDEHIAIAVAPATIELRHGGQPLKRIRAVQAACGAGRADSRFRERGDVGHAGGASIPITP